MIRVKPTLTTHSADRVAQLTALSASLEVLVKREGELSKEQLQLEKGGALPSINLDVLLTDKKARTRLPKAGEEFSVTAEARRLLNGHISQPQAATSGQIRIDEIVRERAACRLALDMGRKREEELRLALSAELGAAQIKRQRELLAEVEAIAAKLVRFADEAGELDSAYRRATGVDPAFTGELPGGFAISEFANAARSFLQRGDIAFAQLIQGRRN